jgi:(p)ppGpp synthase/HD superfamily hydrolase
VAEIVADLGLDLDSVIAALLHDTIEDTKATHEDVAKRFGLTVADLVEGVTKLTRVSWTSKEEEQSENYTVFMTLLTKALERNLVSLKEIWEQIASYGKERQKGICIEGGEILRKLYMMSLGMEEISYAGVKEREQLKDLSGRIKKDFYQKGHGYLDNAVECIERNVNPKFIFCDLCNRIYYNI